jgi:phospholipid/cholesterol/gamma-HCH transport system substrate-binding protein
MQVGEKYGSDLHTDSTGLHPGSAGVLGDSFVDIDSTHAIGPRVSNGSELQQSPARQPSSPSSTQARSPSRKSTVLIHKIETLIDTLKSRTRHGRRDHQRSGDEEESRFDCRESADRSPTTLPSGKGSLGQLINDDTLYTKLNSAVDQLNAITADLQCRQRDRRQTAERRDALQQSQFSGREPEPVDWPKSTPARARWVSWSRIRPSRKNWTTR